MIINQRGIGLVEVLVALIILAIAVLGYSILQVRALEASIEATKRIQGINLARDLAERIRANQQGLSKDIEVETADKKGKEKLNSYEHAFRSSSGKPYENCFKEKTCEYQNLAIEDVRQIKAKASETGMKMAFEPCDGLTRERYCIYVAWDETNPKNGTDKNDCTKDGSYQSNSKCVVMEAY
ncbi:type IV pilus modification protein PilV [Acinetobacter schindleri]|jgi:type IV pilus assembly protein PilV|uniref:type IV pilus modification protein PilV n=1 Tax=Acinetobacter schindleri TaxID=108981 RepID=UPI00200A1FC9|nr:type IV pilus modification protein PilV [Acinetobacter schindleri]MCK8639852.1 type IV pilus modification protein PilV [Acinetobacter schindleri]